MIYSVYNYTTRAYDYYEGDGPKGAHAGTPPITRVRSPLGATPEQASWPIPDGAVKVGSGDMPKGRIGTFETGVALPTVVMMAGLAYLAYKVLR